MSEEQLEKDKEYFRKEKEPPVDVSTFKVGDEVVHRRYGEGIIVSFIGKEAIIDFGGLVREIPIEISVSIGYLKKR